MRAYAQEDEEEQRSGMAGAAMSLQSVWSLADLTMGLMTLCNIAAIILLGGQVLTLLKDYQAQRRAGKDPVFKKCEVKEFASNDSIECW